MACVTLSSLIENMPQDFSIPEDKDGNFFIKDENALVELRKARWLYIKLGEFFNYNIMAVSSDRARKEAYYKAVDYEKIEQNEYICKQISEVYAKILNESGIKAVTIEFNQNYDVNHVGVMMEISSGQHFYCDLTLDLKNIKTGLRTQEFGKNFPLTWTIQNSFGNDPIEWERRSHNSGEFLIDQDLDEFIDVYPLIKYKKCGMYTDEYLEELQKEFNRTERVREYVLNNRELPENQDERFDYILRYKFEFLLSNLQLDELDYMCGRDYLKDAIDRTLLREENSKIYWINLNRNINNSDDSKKFATCFLVNSQYGNRYYFYEGKHIPESMDKHAFKRKLLDEGWNLPKRSKICDAVLDENILKLYDGEGR